MPIHMSSRVMFRLGLGMLLVGAVFALTGASGVLYLPDALAAYPGLIRYVAEALQEILYIGGCSWPSPRSWCGTLKS